MCGGAIVNISPVCQPRLTHGEGNDRAISLFSTLQPWSRGISDQALQRDVRRKNTKSNIVITISWIVVVAVGTTQVVVIVVIRTAPNHAPIGHALQFKTLGLAYVLVLMVLSQPPNSLPSSTTLSEA
jgi:hypothetical protein